MHGGFPCDGKRKPFDTHMRISHLNGWRALEAVLRHGAVTAAAEELGVTTAAVSSQIRALEKRLHRPLFERGPGGLVPLDEVRETVDQLTRGFAMLSEVERSLGSHSGSRQVALTVSQTFAETWLPQHLSSLFARRAGVDIRLETTWEVVDLRRSEMHFAIRFMGPPDADHHAIDLMPSGVVPVCTPNFAERYRLGPGTRSLAGVPLTRIEVPTSDPDWADWPEWSRRTAIPIEAPGTTPVPVPQVAVSGSSLRLARFGIGLVLGGLSEVLHAVDDGTLVMPLGRPSVAPASYWHRLIWLKERRLGPDHRAVRDWIAEHAATDRSRMREVFGV
jgi:DNA-binding transcriptional LysR family regulator